MISTRGRYALRVMIDLATYSDGNYVPMKDVAARQELSLKYLEQILPLLTQANMVEALKGKKGGYRLTKAPSEYLIGDVLRVTEKDLAPVSCLEAGAEPCTRREQCKTISFWEGLNDVLFTYLDSKTLADLL